MVETELSVISKIYQYSRKNWDEKQPVVGDTERLFEQCNSNGKIGVNHCLNNNVKSALNTECNLRVLCVFENRSSAQERSAQT